MEIADSIWYNNDGTHSKLNPTFVSDTLNYYYSDVFAAPFNQETCDAMNAWVKEKTHGMIPKLTDKISPQALLYLVNTIAFEGNWDEPYDKYQVFSGTFTAEDGETFPVEMMNSTEDIYLRDGDAADGFLKYYEGSRYAFAAFLPKVWPDNLVWLMKVHGIFSRESAVLCGSSFSITGSKGLM